MREEKQSEGHPATILAFRKAIAAPVRANDPKPRSEHSCRNCDTGACCSCGSLSPWRCGCNDRDEDSNG